ncbi:MAG TPA: hypothetical protein GX520_11205 [Syntrophaceticus sp.]|nr:hypothetical protein [Syntrophaceticus sp.]
MLQNAASILSQSARTACLVATWMLYSRPLIGENVLIGMSWQPLECFAVEHFAGLQRTPAPLTGSGSNASF